MFIRSSLNQILLLCAIGAVHCLLASSFGIDEPACDYDYGYEDEVKERLFDYDDESKAVHIHYYEHRRPEEIQSYKPFDKRPGKKPGKKPGTSSHQEPKCGRRSFVGTNESTSYIAAGHGAAPGQFPSYVYLKTRRISSKSMCGGTIIDKRYIVTAAHCVSRLESPELLSVKPVVFASEVTSDEGWIQIDKVCKSERYTRSEGRRKFRIRHDLAILKLKSPIEFNNRTQPACLPDGELDPSVQAFAVGMGRVTDDQRKDKRFPKGLQYIPMKRAECNSDKHSSVLCFKSSPSGGPCRGDSGGPILAKVGGLWTVYGATSYGPSKCREDESHVQAFADLNYLRSEIDNLMEECA